MDTARLFAEIVAQKGKVAKAQFEQHAALEVLLRAGLVETRGLVSSVLCDNCHVPHSAEVTSENGLCGYFCPELGFVKRDRAELVALRPNLAAFVGRLGEGLSCRRRLSRPVFGETWRIGSIETSSGAIGCYFHPTLQDSRDVGALADALRREVICPYGLVLTSAGSLSEGNYKTVNISEALYFDANRLEFEFTIDLWTAAGVPVANKGGRPNIFAPGIQAIIKTRREASRSLDGVNAEAKAILEEFKAHNPNGPHPSLSTVKGYVTKSNAGQ